MSKYLTVVYEINDSAAFEPIREQIFDTLQLPEGQPFSAIMVSLDNEAGRLELIEEAVNTLTDVFELRDAIEFILGHARIGSATTLAEIGWGA